MKTSDILQTIISAAIAYLVPEFLKDVLPRRARVTSLPWVEWCAAGLVGGALAGLINRMVGPLEDGIGNWAVFGAAIGLAQWFALRGYRDVGMWFVLSSTVGWIFFLLQGCIAASAAREGVRFELEGWVAAGAAVGLLQFVGLRKWKQAGWWIPGNIIAWPIAGWAGTTVVALLSKPNRTLAEVVSNAVTSLVGAIILLAPLSRLKTD
ncbi:MAG: hypothetical protein JXA89_28510 [Anaerolineae bacterium]|nr:hypothetical protein [Anaerolineae bacterium]